jgi:hypothetical protein
MIFISHSSKDNAAVDRIAEKLETAGLTTWVDHHNGVSLGQGWDTSIRDAILNCDIGLFVMTPQSLNSDLCASECLLLRESGKPLYVVKLEDCAPGDIWLYIKQVQYVDLVEDFNHGMKLLIATLEGNINLAQITAPIKRTVFISYRRETSKNLARLIYEDLKSNGWDVFLDVAHVGAGELTQIILNNIAARINFVLVVSSGSFQRCADSGDWLRREISQAVELNRNIVPVIDEGANFEKEASCLPSDLCGIIKDKSALNYSHEYYKASLKKLRKQFLKTAQ